MTFISSSQLCSRIKALYRKTLYLNNPFLSFSHYILFWISSKGHFNKLCQHQSVSVFVMLHNLFQRAPVPNTDKTAPSNAVLIVSVVVVMLAMDFVAVPLVLKETDATQVRTNVSKYTLRKNISTF